MVSGVDLTMFRSGTFAVSSDGDDGSRNVVWVYPNGGLMTEEITADGTQHTTVHTTDGSGTVLVGRIKPGFDSTYDAIVRSELEGPWKAGTPIDKDLTDGGRIHIDREADATGHQWEHGTRTSGEKDGWITPARDWIRVFHPYGDPDHGNDPNVRESSEWGTKKLPNGQTANYSGTKVTTRSQDENGNQVESLVWTRGEYNPTTGELGRGVVVRSADGTSSRTWITTSADGSWRITTVTTDKNGDGTSKTTTGKGDTVTSDDDPTPVHVDPDEDEPDDNAKTEPSGDGEGTAEGNPDGPSFDSVTMRHLLGDSWKGDADETLGDVEGQLAPYLDRIAAAAKASEHPDSAGLLDSLGAPPDLHFSLEGVAPDETEGLDGLGAPNPFFHTGLDTAAVEAAAVSAGHAATVVTSAHGAASIQTLQAVADDVAATAARIATAHS